MYIVVAKVTTMYIVVTLVGLDVLPEDGPMGTETFRSFMEFSILMCVKMF